MVSILRAIVSGLEHSYENHTPGGMASTFALLEMAHTHYFGKEPEKAERRGHKPRHPSQRPEPGGYPRVNMLPPRPRKVVSSNSVSSPGALPRLPDAYADPLPVAPSTVPMPPGAPTAPKPPVALAVQTRSMSADRIGGLGEVSIMAC